MFRRREEAKRWQADQEAFNAYLHSDLSGSADERLLDAISSAGSHRIFASSWLGPGKEEVIDRQLFKGVGRDALDILNHAYALLGRRHPTEFMDVVMSVKPTHWSEATTVMSILSDIDDPRAIDLLCRGVADDEWLVRYNAVSALGRRTEPEVRPCIEIALHDPQLGVRLEAIECVSRWNPERAVTLMEEFRQLDGLTPLMRQRADAAITDLRTRGFVMDPFGRGPKYPRPT